MRPAGAFLWQTAVRRGLFGGSRAWMTVFAILGIRRIVRRLAGSEPEVVFTSDLKPGEAFVITHLADETLG